MTSSAAASSAPLDVFARHAPCSQLSVMQRSGPEDERLCRPVASLFAAYMATSGDQGPITGEQNAVAVAVFSEPITGLSTASFKIDGPPMATVSALKLLRGTSSYYHILLALPPAYYGPVTLSLMVRSLRTKMNII